MSLSADQQRRMLNDLLAVEGNKICADCDAQDPTWASVNNSVLICFHCAGVHRSLGSQISFVKSVKLDKWDSYDISMLSTAVSNQFINETLLESCVPSSAPVKPNAKSSQETRESYIRAKYMDRAFLPGKNKQRRPPTFSTDYCDSNTLENSASLCEANRPGAVEFVGILKVKILSGKCIGVGMSGNVKHPLYVCMALGHQVLKTKPGKNNINDPIFEEELLFSWDGKDPLNMEVMDDSSFHREETLGYCSVDLLSLNLPSGVPLYLDIPLQDVSSGSLQIEVLLDILDH